MYKKIGDVVIRREKLFRQISKVFFFEKNHHSNEAKLFISFQTNLIKTNFSSITFLYNYDINNQHSIKSTVKIRLSKFPPLINTKLIFEFNRYKIFKMIFDTFFLHVILRIFIQTKRVIFQEISI